MEANEAILVNKDLMSVFDDAGDGVYIVDANQRIVYWNRSAERLLGRSALEVLGRPCYEVISGGDYEENRFCRHNCPTMDAVKRGCPVENYDLSSTRGDGASVWLNISIMSADDAEGKGRLGVHLFRDVTKRRKAEILAAQTIESVRRFQPAEEDADSGNEDIAAPYPAPMPRLTNREQDVLKLLACGASVKDIARDLAIRESTARNHIEHILGKLGVHSRLEAVVYASQYKLV